MCGKAAGVHFLLASLVGPLALLLGGSVYPNPAPAGGNLNSGSGCGTQDGVAFLLGQLSLQSPVKMVEPLPRALPGGVGPYRAGPEMGLKDSALGW